MNYVKKRLIFSLSWIQLELQEFWNVSREYSLSKYFSIYYDLWFSKFSIVILYTQIDLSQIHEQASSRRDSCKDVLIVISKKKCGSVSRVLIHNFCVKMLWIFTSIDRDIEMKQKGASYEYDTISWACFKKYIYIFFDLVSIVLTEYLTFYNFSIN